MRSHRSGHGLFFAGENREFVEIGQAIRFGPKSDLSRTRKCRIVRLDHADAIKNDFEKIAFDFEGQRVPSAGGDLRILASDLSTLAGDHLVQSYIVLKRVRPRDIVILVILRADDDPARLIDAARDGFETNGYADVSDGQTVVDAKWKPIVSGIVAGLGDNLTTRRRGLVVQDHPADRPAVSRQAPRE